MTCRAAVGTVRTIGKWIGKWLGNGRYGVVVAPPQACGTCGRAAGMGVVRLVGTRNVFECWECDDAQEATR